MTEDEEVGEYDTPINKARPVCPPKIIYNAVRTFKESSPRKSRAYHISQEAIAVCNRLDLDPGDAILHLQAEVEKRSAYIDVKKAMREVMQVEGVVLKKDEKDRLESAFALVISEIQKGRGTPRSGSVRLGIPSGDT
ncbi:MAG: hypothetical protein ABSG49_11975 [Methanoregula sp.]|jgi:hypothetical protein|uniref:hypothetical protein n=1 Tax=Methanoregula sp. TaxID=2052170 RepID=UPI003C17C14B